MQKAIKVDSENSLKDLNTALTDGWVLVDMCSMPSSITSSLNANTYRAIVESSSPTCLVIIEKK